MRILALPGFADSTLYWAPSLADDLSLAYDAVEWPGIWNFPSKESLNPVASMLETAIRQSGGETIVVGHSIGAKLACHVASASPAKALILLTPVLGTPSLLSPGKVLEWKRTDSRQTLRPNPQTGVVEELEVPYSIAEGLLQLPPQPMIASPILAILAQNEEERNDETVSLLGSTAKRITLPINHNWWAKESDNLLVVNTVRGFLESL